MALVTIITSIYKGGAHIEGFLADIVRQTAFDECELYLLDANSPDNEVDTIKDYQNVYRNIRYERLDKDPGIYACWNHMIRNSQSELITNCNLDDRLMPICIEKHISAFRETDSDVAYCMNIVVEEPDITYNKLSGDYTIFPTGPFTKERLVMCNLPHNHPVWRRSLHDQCGYFLEQYRSVSDWEFWLRCAFTDKKFHFIPEVLGIYYRNPDGMSTKSSNMEQNLKDVQSIHDQYFGNIVFRV